MNELFLLRLLHLKHGINQALGPVLFYVVRVGHVVK